MRGGRGPRPFLDANFGNPLGLWVCYYGIGMGALFSCFLGQEID